MAKPLPPLYLIVIDACRPGEYLAQERQDYGIFFRKHRYRTIATCTSEAEAMKYILGFDSNWGR